MKLKGPIERQVLLEAVLKSTSHRALAKRLGVSKSTIGFWVYEANKIPLEKVFLLEGILKKQQEKEGLITWDSDIQITQQQSIKTAKEILQLEGIYLNKKLEAAEAKFHLPLRSSLALLLMRCSDQHGEFKLDAKALKEEILPHSDMNFAPILNTLCDLGVVEKFHYEGELYGHITLENYIGSMAFSEDKEQGNPVLDLSHDAHRVKPSHSRQYH